MKRAARSTEAATTISEVEQARIIARAFSSGECWLAERLTDCQRARLWRTRETRYRCRSAACHACRRAAMTRWWNAIVSAWAGDRSTAVQMSGLIWPNEGVPAARLRRQLRDWRDGLARSQPLFAALGMAGFFTGEHAHLVVQHSGLHRDVLLHALGSRWDVRAISMQAGLSTCLEVDHAIQAGTLRRGVEPIRIFVMPQRSTYVRRSSDEEPMPMCC